MAEGTSSDEERSKAANSKTIVNMDDYTIDKLLDKRKRDNEEEKDIEFEYSNNQKSEFNKFVPPFEIGNEKPQVNPSFFDRVAYKFPTEKLFSLLHAKPILPPKVDPIPRWIHFSSEYCPSSVPITASLINSLMDAVSSGSLDALKDLSNLAPYIPLNSIDFQTYLGYLALALQAGVEQSFCILLLSSPEFFTSVDAPDLILIIMTAMSTEEFAKHPKSERLVHNFLLAIQKFQDFTAVIQSFLEILQTLPPFSVSQFLSLLPLDYSALDFLYPLLSSMLIAFMNIPTDSMEAGIVPMIIESMKTMKSRCSSLDVGVITRISAAVSIAERLIIVSIKMKKIGVTELALVAKAMNINFRLSTSESDLTQLKEQIFVTKCHLEELAKVLPGPA